MQEPSVKIQIENTQCRLINLIDLKVLKEIDREISYKVQGYEFMNSPGWDGRYRLLKKTGHFPIGVLDRVCDILRKNNIEYLEEDLRQPIDYGDSLIESPNSNFEKRDYQESIIKTAKKAGAGVIRLATGGGKTAIIGRIVGEYNIETVVYVIGIELLYQMKDTLERLYPGQKIGIIGDGICNIEKITISTIWSAAAAFDKKAVLLESDITPEQESDSRFLNKQKVREMVRSAKMIIIDECQYAAAETIQFLHKESANAKHRFLFSGTPWRETGDDILIEAVGGKRIVDINASYLIDRGYLVRPEIHFLDVPRKKGIGTTYAEIYKNYIVDNYDRNKLIIDTAVQLVSMGRKVLILVTKVKHGKMLLSDLPFELKTASLDGSDSTDDRLLNIQKMKDGRLDILIASKIFDQGVDIPNLDAVILAGSGKSGGRALQRIGRVIRKSGDSKKDAIVIDFKDQAKYLNEHSKARYKIYLTESRFKIKY